MAVAVLEEVRMKLQAWSPPGLWWDGGMVVTASLFHTEESPEVRRTSELPNDTGYRG